MPAMDLIRNRAAELERFDRSGLRVAWTQAFGKAPPHYLSMPFMRKALLWDAQNRRFGGLSADVKRALKAGLESSSRQSSSPIVLTPGSQLVREWNGRTYTVKVLEDGFEMNGARFKSLSQIAREITGARWSGPRFFGLTSRKAA